VKNVPTIALLALLLQIVFHVMMDIIGIQLQILAQFVLKDAQHVKVKQNVIKIVYTAYSIRLVK